MSSDISNEQTIEKYFWRCAEVLRGSMGAASYKLYVFPLIFYKHICDTYDVECAKLAEEKNDPAWIHYPGNHRYEIPEEASWNIIRNVTVDVGVAINNALDLISKKNPRLGSIFGDANWSNKTKLTDATLKDLIEHISTVNLSFEQFSGDELGKGYEFLLGKFADDSGHTAQEFFTNRTLVTLMVRLLRPSAGESIYDPTCGSAGMLTMANKYMVDNGIDLSKVNFYGQEVIQTTYNIGRMNMFIHGIENFDIRYGNTLERPAFTSSDIELKKFNIILANPPYSIKEPKWDRKKFEEDPYGRNRFGVPPSSRADFAFIQHIIESLDPKNGRCAILLPHGILFRGGLEKEIRENVIKSDIIECIIGVGRKLFFNSGMAACVLVCNMNKPDYLKGKIKFINAKDQFVKNGKHNDLSSENIEFISRAFFTEDEIPLVSSIVPVESIAEKNYSLSVIKYVLPDDLDEDITLREAYQNTCNSYSLMKESDEDLINIIKRAVNE